MEIQRVIRLLRRGERGQSLVEFALVLPLFLILVFGIVDFGNALQDYITLSNAAREGARLGVTGVPEATIRQRTLDTAAAVGGPVTVTVTNACGQVGQSLRVQARYTYQPITPLGSFIAGISGGIPLSVSADMRLEKTGC
ncbi:MAG TPA: TadE/TadG family type IV pilus assembly protein [Dehalococcoidia bacterium]